MKIYDSVVGLIPREEGTDIPEYVLSILELVKSADESEEDLNEQIIKLNGINDDLLNENQRLREVNINALLSSSNSEENPNEDENEDENELKLESFEDIRKDFRGQN